MYKNTN